MLKMTAQVKDVGIFQPYCGRSRLVVFSPALVKADAWRGGRAGQACAAHPFESSGSLQPFPAWMIFQAKWCFWLRHEFILSCLPLKPCGCLTSTASCSKELLNEKPSLFLFFFCSKCALSALMHWGSCVGGGCEHSPLSSVRRSGHPL